MKAIEWRASALCAPFIAVLAWGCSGEDGKEPNGSNTGGVAAACTWSTGCLEGGGATGGTGLGGSSGAGGTPSVGGTGGDPGGTGGNGGASGSGGSSGSSGGSASVSGTSGGGASGSGNGGTASDTGDGSAGTDTGNAGTAGIAGTSGGGAGGDPDAGGAAGNGGVAGSGGEPDASTGGTSATGGASGNGGSAGSAGTIGTGGTAGADAGLDADAGAAGTSGTGGGSQDAGSEDAAPQPFSCTGWTRDTTFPSGMDLTGDIWGSSASDVYVATGTYSTGEIAHYDGANWSLMTLPAVSGTWANMNAIWGSSANDVYAGGSYLPTMGAGRSRLLRRQNGGAWAIDSNFPWSVGEGSVRSIWGADANDVFVMVDYYVSGKGNVKIYRKSGSSWQSMTLPPHGTDIMMRDLWGKTASDVYAVGTELDAGSNSVKGLLWHFDGNAWTDVQSLPADVVALGGVHGAGNVQVVGGYWDGANYHGVRLASTDLTSWSRYNSAVTNADRAVWAPWQGAALVGGNILVPPINGAARLGTMSLGSWSSEASLDGIAAYVTGIGSVPNSSQVWLATYGESGFAGAYKGNCQQ